MEHNKFKKNLTDISYQIERLQNKKRPHKIKLYYEGFKRLIDKVDLNFTNCRLEKSDEILLESLLSDI